MSINVTVAIPLEVAVAISDNNQISADIASKAAKAVIEAVKALPYDIRPKAAKAVIEAVKALPYDVRPKAAKAVIEAVKALPYDIKLKPKTESIISTLESTTISTKTTPAGSRVEQEQSREVSVVI